MPRPVIGLVSNLYDHVAGKQHPHARMNVEYFDAIDRAGGLPIILPPLADPAAVEQYLDTVAGVLFVGGYDIDPARYGQPRHPTTEVLAARIEPFIFAMFDAVDRRPSLPVLGICLGQQVFNVARGGTLHQHLPDVARAGAIAHKAAESQYAGGRAEHPVRIAGGSLLARIVDLPATNGRGFPGSAGAFDITVNSGHHQAIDRVGRGLRASAVAPDGIVEALEDPTHRFLLSVQWHPEDLTDQPEHLALFRSLVEAARAE